MAEESRLEELIQRLRTAEEEVSAEIERRVEAQRERFHYSVESGKVKFEEAVAELQRRYRKTSWQYLRGAKLSYILSAPIIYGMVIPIALLDLGMTIYQQICFRIYGIPLVKRSEYLVIDRHVLNYLNAIEKLNCIYCGYGNGVMAYGREITARTEQFWCPIKHAKRARGAHQRSEKFFEYGDAEAWENELAQKRRDWGDSGQ